MISKEQVEHIAELARIELSDKEKEKFSQELSSILDYINKLSQLDLARTESVSQVTGLKNIFRKDEAENKDPNTAEEILRLAPARKGKYFKVPKILD